MDGILAAVGVTPAMHQNLKQRGKGIVVGVFDSPANCSHETLGYDRCTSHFPVHLDKKCITEPEQCDPGHHGAHVASIVAANDTDGEMVGVAPDVKVESWAICTAGYKDCSGGYGEGRETRAGGDAIDKLYWPGYVCK